MITVESEYEGNHFSYTVSTLDDAVKVRDIKVADGAENVKILTLSDEGVWVEYKG